MWRYFLIAIGTCSLLCGEQYDYTSCCCEPNTCFRMDNNQYYASVGGGVVFPMKNSRSKGTSSSVLYSPTQPGTSLFSLPNVVWKNRFDTGYEVNGILGYRVSPCFRVEGEFVYQNFDRKISGSYDWREVNAATTEIFAENFNNPIHHASSHANLYSLFSNVAFDLPLADCFVLSVGGGVGVAWLQADRTRKDNILITPPQDIETPTLEKSPKLFDTAFAWQFKAGMKYEFTKCFSIGLSYRLLGTTRFTASSSKIVANPGTDVEADFIIPQKKIQGLLNSSINLAAIYEF